MFLSLWPPPPGGCGYLVWSKDQGQEAVLTAHVGLYSARFPLQMVSLCLSFLICEMRSPVPIRVNDYDNPSELKYTISPLFKENLAWGLGMWQRADCLECLKPGIHPQSKGSHASQCSSMVPALGKWRQGNQRSRLILGYVASSIQPEPITKL